MADIPAYLTTIVLDGNDITVYCNTVSVGREKSVQQKSSMNGTGIPEQLVVLKTGTVELAGQMDTVGTALLEATFAKDVAVPIIVTVGDGAAITAGTYSGDVTVTGKPFEAAAEDAWNFSLSAVGWTVYTPPV